ncbi:50S ribosomal protein L11 methyltransferase [Chlamydiota bacterium]
MTQKHLHLLVFMCEKKAEEIIANILVSELTTTNFSIHKKPYSRSVQFIIYEKSFKKLLSIKKNLSRFFPLLLKDEFINSIPKIETKKLIPERWQDMWKKSFSPIIIPDICTICPEWISYTPKHRETVITIDPGLAFGTGSHETTQYCLKEINKQQNDQKNLLDVGTGSGILAIAGALFGYNTIIAIDADKQAITSAEENAKKNSVSPQITFLKKSLDTFSSQQQFDVITANITAKTLISNKQKLASLLNSNGILILAGILKKQQKKTVREFQSLRLTLLHQEIGKEWVGLTFQKTEKKVHGTQ